MELLQIYEALTLMGKEVRLQVDAAISAFHGPDARQADAVIERDDVIDNLNTMIEERCFQCLHEMERDEFRTKQIKGAYRLAINLEKLGDYAGNIASQALHLARLAPIARPVDLGPLAALVQAAIDEAVTGFVKRDIALAKQACQREAELDAGYAEILQEILTLLQEPEAPVPHLITHLFAAKYLERMGDSVLNIGEMAIYLITGQRLKLEQYLALERMVDFIQNQSQTPGTSLDFRSLWGGISGARLAHVQVDGRSDFLFKEGAARKIQEELEKADAWNRIVPGVVPLTRRHLADDGREALLREFLDGKLLRDVFFAGTWPEKAEAMFRLLELLREIWWATRKDEPPIMRYVEQIRQRLPELFRLHGPLKEVRGTRKRVLGREEPALGELLEAAANLQASLAPPVAVWIHGDFNINNVFFQARDQRIDFIDVHRSGYGDYLQDVGVFTVSTI